MASELVSVTINDGKYTIREKAPYKWECLRYGENWPAFDNKGPDNLHIALAYEVDRLHKEANTRATPAPCDELVTVGWATNHGHRLGTTVFDKKGLSDFKLAWSGDLMELVTRQNAEEVIAAKDARIAELENEIIKNGEDEDLEQWFYWRRKAKKVAQRCSNQKAQIAGMTKKVTKLEADNKRLREALEPFANELNERHDKSFRLKPAPDSECVGFTQLTFGHFRKARAVLGGEPS